MAAAHGLGTIGDADGARHLDRRWRRDAEPLVRAAALEAAAGAGPAPSSCWPLAVAGLVDRSWQVRVGVGRAGWPRRRPTSPCPGCSAAVDDRHADVRKAAVLALANWRDRPDVRDALEPATKDSDADVRGYARRNLRTVPSPGVDLAGIG